MKVRRFPPIPYDRDATRIAEAAVAARLIRAFTPVRKQVADKLRVAAMAEKFVKAADDDPARKAAEITDGIDLSDFTEQAGGASSDVKPIAADVVKLTAAIGLGDGKDFVGIANERAERAVDDEVAPSIAGLSDTTRSMLRDTIAAGLRNNIGLDAIADSIDSAYALSPDRAALIAATEVSRANSAASLETYKAAAAAGVSVLKEWLAETDCCDVCSGNEAAGPIALDAEFPGGQQCPPGHPRCRCAISPCIVEGPEKMADIIPLRKGASHLFEKAEPTRPVAYQGTQCTMSAYHRRAENLREQRSDLVELQKGFAEIGKLTSSSSALTAQRKAEEIIGRLDEMMAEPMPLPWDLRLAEAEPAGTA